MRKMENDRGGNVDRIDGILNNALFRRHLRENQTAEAGRRFCCHNMAHFLDVARIAEIMNLEEGLGLERDLIYAAALLHDLGRHEQYETGVPHELASAEIAGQILPECGFDDSETGVILEAVRRHRDSSVKGGKDLRGILYRADKASRACFACEAERECDWEPEKKNKTIRY